jgi:hypothetical protein
MSYGGSITGLLLPLLLLSALQSPPSCTIALPDLTLRFNANGQFKILQVPTRSVSLHPSFFLLNQTFCTYQVADQHYANGAASACLDVLPSELDGCSDLNTTAFIDRVIAAEKPDLIVFSGANGEHCRLYQRVSFYLFLP